MKKILLSVLIFSHFILFSQESLSFKVEKAVYKPGGKELNLDLAITNNSDKAVYIIKPQNFFFDLYYDRNNYLERYAGLSTYPYKIKSIPNKKCKLDSDEGYENELIGFYTGDGFKVLNYIVKIPPHETMEFKNIKIDAYKNFCKKRKYKIGIEYAPEFRFEKNLIEDLKTKTNAVERATKELNDYLYNNELEKYKLSQDKNLKRLQTHLDIIQELQKTENKKFESDAIKAQALK